MASTNGHVSLGTRGSPMALWQARWVAEALQKHHPGLTTELVVMRTAGDKNRRDPLSRIGGKGLFVKEIEEALLRQEIDLAVHSMKDVPTTLPPGLHLSAVPPRDDVRDVFVGRDGRRLSETPGPWRIGTSSLRRRAQLCLLHPQLQVQDIRGNVDTRLRKMRQGEVGGVVVAAAGMYRLGLQAEITEFLPVEVMLPAPGQGALGIETLTGHWIDDLLRPLHDPATASAVAAERAFLWHLGTDRQGTRHVRAAPPQRAAAAPLARPAARRSAGQRYGRWGWTGVSGWGRGRMPINLGALRRRSRGGAPQGGPGGTAAGRATEDGWRGESTSCQSIM